MARREVTQYIDDLDNTPLTEDEVVVIRFSLNGTDYLLDVSPDNADKFHATLKPYVTAARKAPVDVTATVPAAEIRRWARENNHIVAHRGKIPREVIDAYELAHFGG